MRGAAAVNHFGTSIGVNLKPTARRHGKGRMEFLEKLLARLHKAQPLKAGSFSELAAQARSELWIDQCVADLGTQETSFATNLLMRGLRAADFIVTKIEAEEPVLAFFEGASRDVLLYEVLHFCLHGISDGLRRMIPPDGFDASTYFSDLAFMAAGELERQHIGQFDVSRHRLERAKHYLRHAGRPKDMTECLIGVLLRARGNVSVEQLEEPTTWDADIEVQINLRGIVHSAAVDSIVDGAEKLAVQYAEKFDRTRYESERAYGLSLSHHS